MNNRGDVKAAIAAAAANGLRDKTIRASANGADVANMISDHRTAITAIAAGTTDANAN